MFNTGSRTVFVVLHAFLHAFALSLQSKQWTHREYNVHRTHIARRRRRRQSPPSPSHRSLSAATAAAPGPAICDLCDVLSIILCMKAKNVVVIVVVAVAVVVGVVVAVFTRPGSSYGYFFVCSMYKYFIYIECIWEGRSRCFVYLEKMRAC